MGRKRMSNKEYRKKLVDRYGSEFVFDYDAVFSGDITLTGISKKHKISKMRATQIFKVLYGVSFRNAKFAGGVTDSTGKHFPYEPGTTKQFMVIVSTELDTELNIQSKAAGKSKAAFIRECIIHYLNKDDPLSVLSRGFNVQAF